MAVGENPAAIVVAVGWGRRVVVLKVMDSVARYPVIRGITHAVPYWEAVDAANKIGFSIIG